jgi:hypothetical protein
MLIEAQGMEYIPEALGSDEYEDYAGTEVDDY